MKLSTWAESNGLSYKTAWRLWKAGRLPLPAEQLSTGTILVHELPTQTNNAVLYARISSGDQAADLERQLQRLREFAAARGLHVVQEVREVGSGLNGHRKKLLKVLENNSASIVVVEHRDRLGEITLSDERLLLTFVDGLSTKPFGNPLVGVDLNFSTVDCTPIPDGRLKAPLTIPTANIEHIQDSFSRRRRRLQLRIKNPQKRARKLAETRGRQRLRIKDALHKLTTELVKKYPGATFVFEDLTKIREKRAEGRRFRTRLNRWPYGMAQEMVEYKSPRTTLYSNPRGTSSKCPVCGGRIEHPTRIPSDIRWRVSVCPTCGVNYDRNRLASLAIACRGSRLCGRPFSVSEDASWRHVRDEYLWHGPVAGRTDVAGGTECGTNAPKEAVS